MSENNSNARSSLTRDQAVTPDGSSRSSSFFSGPASKSRFWIKFWFSVVALILLFALGYNYFIKNSREELERNNAIKEKVMGGNVLTWQEATILDGLARGDDADAKKIIFVLAPNANSLGANPSVEKLPGIIFKNMLELQKYLVQVLVPTEERSHTSTFCESGMQFVMTATKAWYVNVSELSNTHKCFMGPVKSFDYSQKVTFLSEEGIYCFAETPKDGEFLVGAKTQEADLWSLWSWRGGNADDEFTGAGKYKIDRDAKTITISGVYDHRRIRDNAEAFLNKNLPEDLKGYTVIVQNKDRHYE